MDTTRARCTSVLSIQVLDFIRNQSVAVFIIRAPVKSDDCLDLETMLSTIILYTLQWMDTNNYHG